MNTAELSVHLLNRTQKLAVCSVPFLLHSGKVVLCFQGDQFQLLSERGLGKKLKREALLENLYCILYYSGLYKKICTSTEDKMATGALGRATNYG